MFILVLRTEGWGEMRENITGRQGRRGGVLLCGSRSTPHKEALGLSVEDLISGSEESGKPLSIHVERFNPALRLYARLGFRTVADKDVYLLMQRPPRAR
jgi:hypothetical protein